MVASGGIGRRVVTPTTLRGLVSPCTKKQNKRVLLGANPSLAINKSVVYGLKHFA